MLGSDAVVILWVAVSGLFRPTVPDQLREHQLDAASSRSRMPSTGTAPTAWPRSDRCKFGEAEIFSSAKRGCKTRSSVRAHVLSHGRDQFPHIETERPVHVDMRARGSSRIWSSDQCAPHHSWRKALPTAMDASDRVVKAAGDGSRDKRHQMPGPCAGLRPFSWLLTKTPISHPVPPHLGFRLHTTGLLSIQH